ncbi:hypothetical protein QEG73_21620 [Chitinophagaceae bacterium 26-R-25]|nr:hypothetical protein [Chitinophagaceae bacterium 26-R-25]
MFKSISKYLLYLAFFCCMTAYAFAQPNFYAETISNVSDSVIMKEIASFTKAGRLLHPDTLQAKLVEIPISSCSDKSINWAASSFFSSISTFIHIYFLPDSSLRKVDSIFVVTHSHFWVKFPGNAYKGIITSASCNFSGSKKQRFYSDYYKAFYSSDKKRLYIYLIDGTGADKYEVTWVVVNDKYLGRVVDKID